MRARKLLVVGIVGSGCFSGDGTLGAFCREDADCGSDQGCDNSIRRRCGDGSLHVGELCFTEPADPAGPANALRLLAIDVGGEALIAVASDSASLLRGSGDRLDVEEPLALPAAIVDAAVGDLDA